MVYVLVNDFNWFGQSFCQCILLDSEEERIISERQCAWSMELVFMVRTVGDVKYRHCSGDKKFGLLLIKNFWSVNLMCESHKLLVYFCWISNAQVILSDVSRTTQTWWSKLKTRAGFCWWGARGQHWGWSSGSHKRSTNWANQYIYFGGGPWPWPPGTGSPNLSLTLSFHDKRLLTDVLWIPCHNDLPPDPNFLFYFISIILLSLCYSHVRHSKPSSSLLTPTTVVAVKHLEASVCVCVCVFVCTIKPNGWNYSHQTCLRDSLSQYSPTN